jgi:hypothetical protein
LPEFTRTMCREKDRAGKLLCALMVLKYYANDQFMIPRI